MSFLLGAGFFLGGGDWGTGASSSLDRIVVGLSLWLFLTFSGDSFFDSSINESNRQSVTINIVSFWTLIPRKLELKT